MHDFTWLRWGLEIHRGSTFSSQRKVYAFCSEECQQPWSCLQRVRVGGWVGGLGCLHEAYINQKAKESYKWSLECRTGCVKREGDKERWWCLMRIIMLSPLHSHLSEASNYLDTKSSAGYNSLDIKWCHKEITGPLLKFHQCRTISRSTPEL